MDYKIYYYIKDVEKIMDGEYVPPVSCEIDPSNRCQLACSFCMYQKWRKEELVDLDFEIYVGLLSDLKKDGTKSVTFTGGGEPLVHPNFNRMAYIARNMGFDIGLVTNGVALDKVKEDLLSEFIFIRVSLDAASSEVYKAVKGVDYFDRVRQNIENLISRRKGIEKPTIGISYVICNGNEKDVDTAKELATQLKVDYIQFKPALTNGSKFNNFDFDTKGNMEAQTILTNRFVASDTLPCNVAGLVGIVAATGKVYFCCQHRGHEEYVLGDLHEDQFHTIWKRRKDIVPKVNECAPCRYMNYAKKCALILSDKFSQEHKNFL